MPQWWQSPNPILNTNQSSNYRATRRWLAVLGSSLGSSRFHFSGDPRHKLCHSWRSTSFILLILKNKQSTFIYKLIIKSTWRILCISEAQMYKGFFVFLIYSCLFLGILDLQKNWEESTDSIYLKDPSQFPLLLISCITVAYLSQLLSQYW